MVNEPDNFEFLYQGCFTPIYKYLYFRVRNRDLAVDLAQDVFLKAYEQGKVIGPETALRYFYTIARNRLIDHFRKKGAVEVDSFEDLIRDRSDDAVRHPEAVRESQEHSALAHRLLDSLSETDREVVEMKYIQELSNDEISTVTGKTEDNIRQILSRSLKKLKAFHEQEQPDN